LRCSTIVIKQRRNDDKGGIKVYIVVNSNDIDPIMCGPIRDMSFEMFYLND